MNHYSDHEAGACLTTIMAIVMLAIAIVAIVALWNFGEGMRV